MTKPYPATAKEAIIVFHFADRIKAELIIASRLLGAVIPLKDEQQEGGGRIFLEYLRGLEQEIILGSGQIKDPEMVRVKTVIAGLMGMAESRMYQDMQQHLTWMLTIMTTYAQRAMELLLKEKLM
jgi:hypothetical protein